MKALVGVRKLAAALLTVLGVMGLTATLYAGYGPLPDRAPRQLRFLDGVLASGRERQMQALFPEGEFFTRVLTGLAEARSGESHLAHARARLAAIETPDSLQVFGSGMVPDHGIFAAGWSLALAVAIAQASGTEADRQVVRDHAQIVYDALRQPGSPFAASYPGQFWPCDSVVAAGSLAEAIALLGLPWRADLVSWRQRALAAADSETGLLAHQVDAQARALVGPRGSSQAIIQTFWPALNTLAGAKDAQWQQFTGTFVAERAGLLGVLEYPRGVPGAGDVDSGPLVFGVSLSASAVGLAAARANGDRALAGRLTRQVELFGIPTGLQTTRYLFGLLPVADAFIAWARTVPEGEPPISGGSGRSAWALAWTVPPLLVIVCGVALRPGKRRRRRNTTQSGQAAETAH